MDSVLQQQIDYYRARAGEYDEWFLRQGRYDRGEESNKEWFAEVAEVEAALESLHPSGRILEFAGGTGIWSQRLVRNCASLTVVDSSPEVLALNEARLSDSRTRYDLSDIFTWSPDQQYDMVFFSFWLSHVPEERFAAFWDLVRRSLRPGGRAFLLDSRYNQLSTAADHTLNTQDSPVMVRRLNDGREFLIVKMYYEPDILGPKLERLGWQTSFRATANHFIYGSASF